MSDQHSRDVPNSGCWFIPQSVKRVWKRYSPDQQFRENISYTICVYLAFFIIGWRKGQFGPSYIDLRMITDTDLEQGSWIITTIFIGYTSGSFVHGFLYTRVNRKLMLSTALFMMSAAIAIVPWCVMIEVMLPTYFVVGLVQGVIDTGGNAEVVSVWKQEGRLGVLGLNFVFAFGSVLAPLVITSFLVEIEDESLKNTTVLSPVQRLPKQPNNTYINETCVTNTTSLNLHVTKPESNIYIPFSILAGLSVLVASLFVYSYVKYDRGSITGEAAQSPRPLPKSSKAVMLSIIGTMFLIHNAVDDTFAGLLSSYCVEYFHWTKKDGGFISTIFFLFVLGARFISTTLEKYMNTLICIGINLTLMLISVLGLLLVSLYTLETGVWVFVSLFGYSTSCVFALMLSWTNEYITMVTGRISSFLFVSAMIGSALNPLLLSFLMKRFGLIWFCYLFLIELIIQFIVFVVGLMGTKYIVKNFGKTFDTSHNKH
ncbi:sodium-dependent glucose transporter 1A-like [Pecten maximus]|uniref:sodium-dependent glucose transporter 1A-like n=1 Tax=Pecten maximus TaxID=6579 RepID=UPI001457EFE5|nr:sodium-dependent glucose transporter 1A-like [Pecten maximus]